MAKKTYQWQILLTDGQHHQIEWSGTSTFFDGESQDEIARIVAEYTLSQNPHAKGRSIDDFRYQVGLTEIG